MDCEKIVRFRFDVAASSKTLVPHSKIPQSEPWYTWI